MFSLISSYQYSSLYHLRSRNLGRRIEMYVTRATAATNSRKGTVYPFSTKANTSSETSSLGQLTEPVKRRVYIPKLQQYPTSQPANSFQTKQKRNLSFSPPKDESYTDSTSYNFQFPYGDARNERIEKFESDMELTFLGTASCTPSITRGVNSIALRYLSDTYLFDCGESTQVQIQKSSMKLSRIRKIFITHLHGDHFFGLPGLLCLLGSAASNENANDGIYPIDIYGPEGIRHYIRASLQLTYSRIAVPHRIHELKNIPFLHQRHYRFSPIPENHIHTRFDPAYGERPGGRDIYPDSNGIYQIPSMADAKEDEEELIFQAAPMQHTIPCVGYVATEKERPGSLKMELVQPLVESQRRALVEQYPFLQGQYPKIYAFLKALKPDESFTFPNGQVIKGIDITSPPRDIRKIVVMGDTCNGESIKSIAMNATVLIHEATNAFFPHLDSNKFQNHYELERDSYLHGHSTPQMAGRFAKSIGAKRLLLTHFSPRYRGDSSFESMNLMWSIENMARLSYPALSKPNDVIAAWDLLNIAIPNAPRDMYKQKRDDTELEAASKQSPESINQKEESSNDLVANESLEIPKQVENSIESSPTIPSKRKRGRPRKAPLTVNEDNQL